MSRTIKKEIEELIVEGEDEPLKLSIEKINSDKDPRSSGVEIEYHRPSYEEEAAAIYSFLNRALSKRTLPILRDMFRK